VRGFDRHARLAVLMLAFAAVVPAAAQPEVGGLDAIRRACVAAARDLQQQERRVAALEHVVYLLGRDADGRQRGLDDSRREQQGLLAAIELVARNPPEFFTAAAPPLDRLRGEVAIAGTVAALREEAHALAADVVRVGQLRRQIVGKEGELAAARDVLGRDRTALAALVVRRLALVRQILPEEPGDAAQMAALGREAGDTAELIKRADAAAERRDRRSHARAKSQRRGGEAGSKPPADMPPALRAFEPPQSALVMPVSGSITQRFGAIETGETPSPGIAVAAPPGAVAVAPFDGEVTYAGPFGDRGVVLIIRHGGLYHSLLAGLGRADVRPGEWVLAGEPVGMMPETPDNAPGGPLCFELRRDGSPVDPQPWLAPREEGRNPQSGERKVPE
jgi:murein hydrolase activator